MGELKNIRSMARNAWRFLILEIKNQSHWGKSHYV